MKSILKKQSWLERRKMKGKKEEEEEEEEAEEEEEEETCNLKSDEPGYISNHKLTMVRSNSKINVR